MFTSRISRSISIRLVTLVAVGLALLAATGQSASASVFGSGAAFGQTTITCFNDYHQAYFEVRMASVLGVVPSNQTLAVKIDSYKYNSNARNYFYDSTSGWKYAYGAMSIAWWSGVQSGYWWHKVTYAWAGPNGWETGSEWIGPGVTYVQRLPNTPYGSYPATYCTT